VSTTVATA